MKQLNLSTRVEMFSICASLEFDVKNFILTFSEAVNFSQEMLEKSSERDNSCDKNDVSQVLNLLDLSDYIEIIKSNPHGFSLNNEKSAILGAYFEKIIPVRNRVMHTKPLELGDRALLIEVMQQIDFQINFIPWKELRNTKNILETDPTRLLSIKTKKILEYRPKTYHNLPEPEFDDTGYIGRKDQMNRIRALVLNKKNQIITIVGNGGIGKTAIVVKTLYDLLEDPSFDFECIAWISLKTKTLARGEFQEIDNCLHTIPEMFSKLHSFMITNNSSDKKNDLLNFMAAFKTLLVLDNLETINSKELNSFFRDIPEISKVLITSRSGIGEFEVREKLDGLSLNEATVYFRELSKYYGLDLHKKKDPEIKKIVCDHLFSSPLSIKWFVSGIFAGASEQELLSHKDELINFCISNIYEKLSENSKKILKVLLLEQNWLSYGQLDYLLNLKDVDLRNALNELQTTYMVHTTGGKYLLNDMCRQYISINYPPEDVFMNELFGKRRELKEIMRSVRERSESTPFSAKAINGNFSDEDKQLAVYYLNKAIDLSTNGDALQMDSFLDKAASIAPDFFEVYKITAKLHENRKDSFRVISNYNIALTKCENDKEKGIVHYFLAYFYNHQMQNPDLALGCIEEANECFPNNCDILLEKISILVSLSKYEPAEEILNELWANEKNPKSRTQNILATKFGEIQRKIISNLPQRETEKKFQCIILGIEKIKKVDILDDISMNTLLGLLRDLSFLYKMEKSMKQLSQFLKEFRLQIVRVNNNYKKVIFSNIANHQTEINSETLKNLQKYSKNFDVNFDEISEKNKGMVTDLREDYGFISNSSCDNSIMFLKKDAENDIECGDLVKFESFFSSPGRLRAVVVKKISSYSGANLAHNPVS